MRWRRGCAGAIERVAAGTAGRISVNILGRFAARWLVGLFAVLTVLSHVSDAGRTARAGIEIGVDSLSLAGDLHPALASQAPQTELRLRGHEPQPLPDGAGPGDALAAVAPVPAFAGRPPAAAVAAAALLDPPGRPAPGQRAPPLPLPKA
jgi:hypothetical protein